MLTKGSGKGYVSAFWLHAWSVPNLGNMGKDGTEIDIVERYDPRMSGDFQHALHWDGYGENEKTDKKKIYSPHIEEKFHTFSLYWSEFEYIFYVDGMESWRTNSGGVSQVPEFVYLTTEIMDQKKMVSSKPKLPDAFSIDYVRVYTLKDKQMN